MLYQFEDYSLDTDKRELRRGHSLIPIEPQVFDLLELLIRSHVRVVSRDELIETVWSGRIVSESTLSSRINAARAAIGDNGSAQRLIKTMLRRGFRFVGQLQDAASATSAAQPPTNADQPTRTHTSEGPSIAVLPFASMSGDPEGVHIADGITEEILTSLSRCKGTLVIARHSSLIYKGIAIDVRTVGRELGVGYVLEGSVRRMGDRVRITAQLIETRNGSHIWADRFDGGWNEAFELQDRIASFVSAAIEPRLWFAEIERARRQSVESWDAYDHWLNATMHATEFSPEGMSKALQSLEASLQSDPAYAMATASIAYYHALCRLQGWPLGGMDGHAKGLQLAWDAIGQAKENANVLWQAAVAIWVLGRDRAVAHDLFRRSLEINPNSPLALALAGLFGATGEEVAGGRRLIEKSRLLNPRPPREWLPLTALAIACLAEKKTTAAIDLAEKASTQNPRFSLARATQTVGWVEAGDLGRAREAIKPLLDAEPRLTVSQFRDRLPPMDHALLKRYVTALGEAGMQKSDAS